MNRYIYFIVTCLFLFASTYLSAQDFYDANKIQEIRLTFSQSNWHEILTSLKEKGEERLLVKVSINGEVFDSVGVRYKGNSSFNAVEQKKPFNIKLDYKIKDQNYQQNETVKLSNAFRDPSFVREVLAYEIARKYMPAPKANFAKVYVNGKYHGLYTNVESIDSKFLKGYFGEGKKQPFFKCNTDKSKAVASGCKTLKGATLEYIGDNPKCYEIKFQLKSKSENDWKELLKMIYTLNNEPDKIATVLNVDATLKYLAFNSVVINLDSYSGLFSHNYYLYQDATGQFQPLVWDLNMAFGGFNHSGQKNSLSLYEMQNLDPFLHENNPQRPLIHQLLKKPAYRQKYITFMETILSENFTSGWYAERAKELQRIIEVEVKNDPNKLYSFEAFKNNLATTENLDGNTKSVGILELMQGRRRFLEQQLEM
ncbi:MAG: CotH kinase family protein [Chitinophagales bacterium]